jgi:hypothetical protein
MVVTLRGCRLAAGQVRRLWRQSVDYVGIRNLSWTHNAYQANNAGDDPGITRALRYLTRSFYMGAGIDHSRFDMLHTTVKKQNVYKTVTVNAGQRRNPPTVRNRMTSFGSRVPTLNQQAGAAQSQDVGGATQA